MTDKIKKLIDDLDYKKIDELEDYITTKTYKITNEHGARVIKTSLNTNLVKLINILIKYQGKWKMILSDDKYYMITGNVKESKELDQESIEDIINALDNYDLVKRLTLDKRLDILHNKEVYTITGNCVTLVYNTRKFSSISMKL